MGCEAWAREGAALLFLRPYVGMLEPSRSLANQFSFVCASVSRVPVWVCGVGGQIKGELQGWQQGQRLLQRPCQQVGLTGLD